MKPGLSLLFCAPFAVSLLIFVGNVSVEAALTEYFTSFVSLFGYGDEENNEQVNSVQEFKQTIPYEVSSADENFISKAIELTGVAISPLDTCQHRVSSLKAKSLKRVLFLWQNQHSDLLLCGRWCWDWKPIATRWMTKNWRKWQCIFSIASRMSKAGKSLLAWRKWASSSALVLWIRIRGTATFWWAIGNQLFQPSGQVFS